jgi:TPR repeat protein
MFFEVLLNFFRVRPEDTTSNETDEQASSITRANDAFSQGEQVLVANETDEQPSSSTQANDTSSQGKQAIVSDEDVQSSVEKLYCRGIILNDIGCYKKAAGQFQKAIDRCHGPSHAQLASMLLNGRPGLPKDIDRVYHLAITGTALGCEHSKGVLAQCLVFGLGIPKDPKKGLALAKESAVAGSFFGLYVIGFFEKDYWKSLDILMSAYNLGSVDACFRLGQIYEDGYTFSDNSRIPKSYEKAFRYYSRAAKQGHLCAMMIVAYWCKVGTGTNVDVPRTLSLLREIASGSNRYYPDVHGIIVELSHDIEEIKAIIVLMDPVNDVAYRFEKWSNHIVRLNAIVLYQILAAKGHLNSQVWLAEDAHKKKEFSLAVHYFGLAADQGNSKAQHELGKLFLGGWVPRDEKKAVDFFRLAVEKGNNDARLSLAIMLLDGKGVEKNSAEAFRLLRLAAPNNRQANYLLEVLEE